MISPIKMFTPEPAMLGKDMEFQSSAITFTVKGYLLLEASREMGFLW